MTFRQFSEFQLGESDFFVVFSHRANIISTLFIKKKCFVNKLFYLFDNRSKTQVAKVVYFHDNSQFLSNVIDSFYKNYLVYRLTVLASWLTKYC